MRLTSHIRDQILSALLRRSFDKRQGRLKKSRTAFGMSVYKKAWGPSDRKKMAELPDGWLPKIDYIKVAINEDGSRNTVDHFSLDHKIPVPDSHEHYALMVVDSQTPRLLDRWRKIRDEKYKLESDLEIAAEEARRILNSVTTVKRLKQHWPEISEIVDNIAPVATTVTALVAPVKKANELFGLK